MKAALFLCNGACQWKESCLIYFLYFSFIMLRRICVFLHEGLLLSTSWTWVVNLWWFWLIIIICDIYLDYALLCSLFGSFTPYMFMYKHMETHFYFSDLSLLFKHYITCTLDSYNGTWTPDLLNCANALNTWMSPHWQWNIYGPEFQCMHIKTKVIMQSRDLIYYWLF